MTILGAIEIRPRTTLPGLNACLASVRHWNPDSRILVFNRSMGHEGLTGLLSRYGVEVIPWEPLLGDNGVELGRFVQYGHYLQTHPIDDRIVMIDLLDVVAQGPWSTLPPGVFEENKIIRECPYNSAWMRIAFPEQDFKDHTVICCGAIVADPVWALDYTQAYIDNLASRRCIAPGGFDTSFLTYYVRTRPGRTQVFPYWNLAAMHIGYAPTDTVHYTNQMIDIEGGIPLLVHQYNRHKQVWKPVHRQWGV